MAPCSTSKSPTLFEELIANKQGLGAKINFEPNTLEFKLNKHGVNGVFTRRSLSEGTDILSVQEKDGSLTPFRAYEEAQELLQKLGSDRYNLPAEFCLACAMYLRYMNAENRESDLLLSQTDIKSSYSGSPATAYGSKDFVSMVFSNSKVELKKAIKQDEMINKMEVNRDLFRTMLGYANSRCWNNFGVIPVFDWLNSSYKEGANCIFIADGNCFLFRLLRDVEAGEELVWSYNDNTALLTWLNYGYRDYERPTLAFLEFNLSEEQVLSLESFVTENLSWLDKHDLFPSCRIDKCQMNYYLRNPANLPTPTLLRKSITECLKSFIDIRTIFRAIVLCNEQQSYAINDSKKQKGNDRNFGLELEQKVVAYMLSALKTGLMKVHQRVEQFKTTEVGRTIDMVPYVDMIEEANAAWIKALEVIETICLAKNIDDCIKVINSALDLNLNSKDEVKPALVKLHDEDPTILVSLIIEYTPDLH